MEGARAWPVGGDLADDNEFLKRSVSPKRHSKNKKRERKEGRGREREKRGGKEEG